MDINRNFTDLICPLFSAKRIYRGPAWAVIPALRNSEFEARLGTLYVIRSHRSDKAHIFMGKWNKRTLLSDDATDFVATMDVHKNQNMRVEVITWQPQALSVVTWSVDAKMANWREEVLLEGEFRVSSKKRVLFKVTLTPVGLYYSPITSSNQYEEKLVRMSDIVGCQCTESSSTPSKLQSDSIVAAFTVFAYPFRKKVFTGKRIRHRQVTTFEISTCKSFEENWKICRKWRSVICSLARDIPVRPEGKSLQWLEWVCIFLDILIGKILAIYKCFLL